MLLSVEIRCPDCDSPSVIRHGHTPQATQRFRCRRCARTFINPADQRGYSQTFKEQVLAAYQERASMRGISRVFGISRNTLVKWLKQKGGNCPT
jgi:transposase-like protein